MKYVSLIAAAALALSPLTAVAQEDGPNNNRNDQFVGVPPGDPLPTGLPPVPDGTVAAGVGALLLVGAGLGVGLGSGGGDGATGTTGTTP